MKKLDFTSNNVVNCVHNEPALWDTECTDVRRKITARIDSYHARHITRFETSLQQACDTLTQVCDQIFDQVCNWLE